MQIFNIVITKEIRKLFLFELFQFLDNSLTLNRSSILKVLNPIKIYNLNFGRMLFEKFVEIFKHAFVETSPLYLHVVKSIN